jgi:hypothetical protein
VTKQHARPQPGGTRDDAHGGGTPYECPHERSRTAYVRDAGPPHAGTAHGLPRAARPPVAGSKFSPPPLSFITSYRRRLLPSLPPLPLHRCLGAIGPTARVDRGQRCALSARKMKPVYEGRAPLLLPCALAGEQKRGLRGHDDRWPPRRRAISVDTPGLQRHAVAASSSESP